MIQFTLAVFAVNLLGGAVIALGPGQAVLALVPQPGRTARYILETDRGGGDADRRRSSCGAGARSLARHELPSPSAGGRSSFLLGVTISASRAPHRVPVFRGDRRDRRIGPVPPALVLALALYNLAFVLPLILMSSLTVAGDRAQAILEKGP